MNTTASKKDFFYIIVLILTFITVIIGATFALYSFVFGHEEGSSSVYTGTLSIEYSTGNIIKFNKLKPRKQISFADESNLYKNKFKVTNTGTLDTFLSVVLEVKVNEFSNETLMYSLYDETGLIEENYLEGQNELILSKNVQLKREKEKDFVLIIWLKENGQNQNEEMKKNLIGQIRVDAYQKKD